MGASEKTVYNALRIFQDEAFRERRRELFPSTNDTCDARAATFESMLEEGRFDETIVQPMTVFEQAEFDVTAEAVLKLSRSK